MNNDITLVAIINEKGKIMEIQGRNSIIDKLPCDRKEMFFLENYLIRRMRTEFEEELGNESFSYVEWDRRGILSFPMNGKLLLVSFSRMQFNSLALAGAIMSLVNKYNKRS